MALNKRLYKEKIEDIGAYSVWIVDGEYVRKELDENFVGFDQYLHLQFIPKNEMWIDEATNPDERHFFVDHLLAERWAVQAGSSPEEAYLKADAYEKKERQKIIHLTDPHLETESKKKLLKKIHKKRIGQFATNLHLWLVDGEIVRDTMCIEYFDGGHDRVYSFIPTGEVWIEEQLSKKEQFFILLHELHERFLMGQGKDYAHAHRGATQVEDFYRDHPAGLEKRIEEEIKKNESNTSAPEKKLQID